MPLAGCSPVELLEKTRRSPQARRRGKRWRVRVRGQQPALASLLVVPVGGATHSPVTEAASGWLDVLHPAIFPKAGGSPGGGSQRRGVLGSVKTAVGASVPRVPTVVREGAVRPGLQSPPRPGSTASVVVGPGLLLELDKQDDVGLRHAAYSGRGRRRGRWPPKASACTPKWQARSRVAASSAARPPRTAWVTVTELTKQDGAPAPTPPAVAPSVAIEQTDAVRTARPHGKRFGVLTHAILSAVDLASDVAAVFSRMGEGRGAPPGCDRRRDCRRCPRGCSARWAAFPCSRRRPARQNPCRREAPILLDLPDGRPHRRCSRSWHSARVQADGPVWTVVDFKDDVENGRATRGLPAPGGSLRPMRFATASG